MNKNKILIPIFAAVVAVQLAVPAWMIVKREITLKEGAQFKFRTQPVDPADAFRGRYVWLRLEPDSVKVPETSKWEHGQRAYAVLSIDTNGFAKVTRLDRAWPADEPAIAVRIGWNDSRSNILHFTWPLDRYYMEEKKAPAAEKAYRNNSNRKNRNCYVTVRVRGGNAVLEELFIDGKPVREYLKKP